MVKVLLVLGSCLVVGCGGSGSHSSGGGGGGAGGGSGGGSSSAGGGGKSSGGGGGSAGGGGGGGSGPQSGSGIFPSTSIFYEDISGAAVDSEWATILAAVGSKGFPNGGLDTDFSIVTLTADSSVTPRAFTQNSDDFFSPDCDTAPIPVPPGGAVEGSTDYSCPGGDCHLLVTQGTRLYEAWVADITGGTATGTPFSSGCLTVWDLTKDYWQANASPYSRGDQCTGADAADLPITPLLFTPDEVAAGEIAHAIRFIMPSEKVRKDAYVHPATHTTGTGGTSMMPYGARLRLKASFDVSKLSKGAQVVAAALKKYGMFMADTTGDNGDGLTAESDQFTTTKWSGLFGANDLASLTVDDFEMVDGGTRITYTGDCNHTPISQ